MEKIVSDIGSDLMGEVYRFEVKRRGTRTQQIAPRYTQGLHFNSQAVEHFITLDTKYNLSYIKKGLTVINGGQNVLQTKYLIIHIALYYQLFSGASAI